MNRKHSVMLIVALILIMVFPVNVAAKAAKLVKTEKVYQNGKLVHSKTFTYDKKGCMTKRVVYNNYNGEKQTTTTKFKLTYWSEKSGYLKKAVITYSSSGNTEEQTYNKNGLLKKRVTKDANGNVLWTGTCTNNGKVVTSYVQKDKEGKVTKRYNFDKYGNFTRWREYVNGVNTVSITYRNILENGVVIKRSYTDSSGIKWIQEYYNDGREKKATRDPGGYDEYNYTLNADGLIKEKVCIQNGDHTASTTKYAYTAKRYNRKQPSSMANAIVP